MRALGFLLLSTVAFGVELSKTKEYDIVYPILHRSKSLNLKSLEASNNNESKASDLAYAFSALGREFYLELKESQIFLPGYKEIRVGDPQVVSSRETQGNVPFGCYYEGKVRGDYDSTVVLSTCNGLHGFITTRDLVIAIEPLSDSINSTLPSTKGLKFEEFENATLPHIAYRYEGLENTDWFTCGVNTPARNHASPASGVLKWLPRRLERIAPSRTLKVLVINDKARYQSLGQSVEADSAGIFNAVAQFYRSTTFGSPLQLSFAGQLTFTKGDPYQPSQTGSGVQVLGPNGLLMLFNKYRKSMARTLPSHDIAVLFSSLSFEQNILGLAEVGSLCSSESGVITELKYDLVRNAVIVAHEMGHTLGMQHDGTGNQCAQNGYIMAPSSSADTRFSSCSISYAQSFLSSNPRCLSATATAIEDKCKGSNTGELCSKESVNVQSDSTFLQRNLTTILSVGGLVVAVLALIAGVWIFRRWWIGQLQDSPKDVELKVYPSGELSPENLCSLPAAPVIEESEIPSSGEK